MNYIVVLVDISEIDDNPWQPRQVYAEDALAELAVSIREHGVLQPPLVRQMPDGRCQLAFGHRRLRAAKLVGLTEFPVQVAILTDEQMARYAWTENRERKDLTAIEEAEAIERMMADFAWSQKKLAEKLGMDRSTISNKLRLLKLPSKLRDAVRAGQMSERQAVAILPIIEMQEKQVPFSAPIWVRGRSWSSYEQVYFEALSMDSGDLRDAVDLLRRQMLAELKGEWTKQSILPPAPVEAPTCAECSFRLADNRCGRLKCIEARKEEWRKTIATAAAEAVGLPASGKDSRQCNSLYHVCDIDALKTVAQGRVCEHLVVVQSDFPNHKIPDHPKCAIVCAKHTCACAATLGRLGTPEQSKDAERRVDRQRIKREVVEPAIHLIARHIQNVDICMAAEWLRMVNSPEYRKYYEKLPNKHYHNVELLSKALAAVMVDREINDWDAFADASKKVIELCKRLDLMHPLEQATLAERAA